MLENLTQQASSTTDRKKATKGGLASSAKMSLPLVPFVKQQYVGANFKLCSFLVSPPHRVKKKKGYSSDRSCSLSGVT